KVKGATFTVLSLSSFEDSPLAAVKPAHFTLRKLNVLASLVIVTFCTLITLRKKSALALFTVVKTLNFRP
ncbi:hypothetical protein, partial [Pseudoalteromonas luteoviolacea]|uniref:hypothetical protein n=1 Tax=Pseudoalteromonas luteoviolacea TaxID=43657 RepID=UPI001E403495